MSKKALIAFECSGVVRRAFRAIGCDAYSNDLQPADDDSEFHILGDAIDAIKSQEWDLIIAHPPCTALAVSGNPTEGLKRGPFFWVFNMRRFVYILKLGENKNET